MNKPKKPKGPSLKKAASTYKKAHTKPKTAHEGARYFSDGANPYGIGQTDRKLKYTPKAKSMTFGTSTPTGGGTKRVRVKKAGKSL